MSTIGVKFESNGCQLVGRMWLAKGDQPRPTVLLLHGIPGIDQNHDLAFALKNAGWNSLLMHYRGSWGSEGDYSLHNILLDVDAMLAFLLKDEDVDNDNIIICGHSLGGWAAVIAGARHPEVKAVVSLAGVSDWKKMGLTAEGAGEGMARFLSGVTPQTLERESQELDSAVDAVEQMNGRPLLIVHGDADDAVPVAHSEALVARYPDHTQLHIIGGADHGFSWERQEMIETVINWIEQLS